MKRSALAIALWVFSLNAQAGEGWTKLWRNADQRGEALLQQGDAKSAADVYADPHRKAYAKMQAGDYAGAAKDLVQLHDHDADYNRGNALAHAGDLQGALDAYNTALNSNPDNRDAQHNRELVEKAMKQQPPQQKKSGGNDSENDQKDDKQNKEKDSKEQEQKKQDEQGDGKNREGKDNKSKDEKQSKSGQPDDKSGKGQDSSSSDKKQPGKPSDQSTQDDQSNQGKQQLSTAKDEAEQARRDAEASLAKPAADAKDEKDKAAASGKESKSVMLPKTEQQIAKEQWLRNIPDDPGGLLRRKFMIEHMMRQQKAQQ